jgi:23S rRNA (pseudouridine1915-N3)-methyltransferase
MKIKLICVGKIKESFFRDAISEYIKRISKFSKVEIIECQDEKTPDNAGDALNRQIMEKEGERILSKIAKDDYVITLEILGKELSSIELSDKINDILNRGVNSIAFIIGGSLGLSDTVKKRADFKLSFSKMTFPHQLMRVVLLEQIYRSFKIQNNEPYHK